MHQYIVRELPYDVHVVVPSTLNRLVLLTASLSGVSRRWTMVRRTAESPIRHVKLSNTSIIEPINLPWNPRVSFISGLIIKRPYCICSATSIYNDEKLFCAELQPRVGCHLHLIKSFLMCWMFSWMSSNPIAKTLLPVLNTQLFDYLLVRSLGEFLHVIGCPKVQASRWLFECNRLKPTGFWVEKGQKSQPQLDARQPDQVFS
jgi:hypothetical protein